MRARGESLMAISVLAEQSEEEISYRLDLPDGELRVRLVSANGQLRAFCPCAPFVNGGRCEHVWGAIRAAEDLGWLEIEGGPAGWRRLLWDVEADVASAARDSRRLPVADFRIVYVLIAAQSGPPRLRVFHQRRLKDGDFGGESRFDPERHRTLDPADAELMDLLLIEGGGADRDRDTQGTPLSGPRCRVLLRKLAETGRLFLEQHWRRVGPFRYESAPWRFRLRVAPAGASIQLDGELVRGEQSVSVGDPHLILTEGFVFHADEHVAPVELFGAYPWIPKLRGPDPITLKRGEKDSLIDALLEFPALPELKVEGWKTLSIAPDENPHPILAIRSPSRGVRFLTCELSFRYGAEVIGADEARAGVRQTKTRVLLRNQVREAEARAALRDAGCEFVGDGEIRLSPASLPMCVDMLLSQDFTVEADGAIQRRGGAYRFSVASGIDWFSLKGEVRFDGQVAKLPEILAAVRRGERTVKLGDGSNGIMPDEWLRRFRLLDSIGTVKGSQLRLSRAQGLLIDVLLTEREAAVDVDFAGFCQRLRDFKGIQPRRESSTFRGELREYQRGGLAWMRFLNDMQLGGCLADDMGLGKTVQVLALLDQLKGEGDGETGGLGGPVLIVAPRSVAPNWVEEAERFTPELKVRLHLGPARGDIRDYVNDFDVLVTTYGTLRSDIILLKDVELSYAILDESQAIKNERSQAAKAARLLRARNRLALSGTPIENHLGELWSLFEFLNPGMLGRSTAFQRLLVKRSAGILEPEAREVLSRTLRPFLLRRTKSEVEEMLPERIEQTVKCTLDDEQRAIYDELLTHYRAVVLAGPTATVTAAAGDEGSASPAAPASPGRMDVLAALLRLRQASCHPGLLDKAHARKSFAKIDALMPMLEEVVDAGHKALVFSQFTSLLDLVEPHLNDRSLAFERLDGSTNNRQERIDRFQTDPTVPIFLISLKAGGVGLNLTAAGYVFILDPWWNPAAEAQAIDRAHRIGQKNRVVACRLIAKDTVEERILELQASKRELAEAIVGESGSLMKDLTAADLAALFR